MDSTKFSKNIILGFCLLLAFLFLCYLSIPDNNLHIVTCDVGQGDATLIFQKNNQILIDGGPDNSVLNCLGKYMPFYDRTIELVILTHSDADHSTGLIEVFRRYQVDLYLRNNLNTDTQVYRLLEKEVGSRGIKVIEPSIGQRLRLGLIYLDTLWPNGETFKNTNDYSIITRLEYGSFKAVFTGDLEDSLTDKVRTQSQLGVVEYIKVSHHGSRNGITNKLLDLLRPKVAVISAGKKNRYGHPHEETLDLLKNNNIKVLRTDEVGDIEIISNGKSFWQK